MFPIGSSKDLCGQWIRLSGVGSQFCTSGPCLTKAAQERDLAVKEAESQRESRLRADLEEHPGCEKRSIRQGQKVEVGAQNLSVSVFQRFTMRGTWRS